MQVVPRKLGKGRGCILYSFLEEIQPCQLDFSLVPYQTSDLQNCKIINVSCSKPLHLCGNLLAAAVGNQHRVLMGLCMQHLMQGLGVIW